jgi:formylglycine-generating enzyme required for sulfatase activity
MKKVLTLILLCFCVSVVYAQETKELKIIGKAKKLETGEMVARRDGNGNYCAAIQLVSNLEGFTYDSFDGIVGNIDDKPGMDMVYLTSTERVLQIFKTGFKPLKIILSDYGISLKPREVWQIEINGENTADQLPVTIRFTPADASLSIDGKPLTLASTYNLSVGQHSVNIAKDGFQSIEKTISVDDKNVFFEYKLLKQADAALQIETIPEGATVYLDGVNLGVSPIAAFYKPGNYPIKITKEGYVGIENQILEVITPQTIKSYTLEENVGYLTVNTNPLATVYFNNEKVTNYTNAKLAPQLVKIKVVMPKAETLEQQIVLKRNDNQVIDMFPEVQTGSLQIAVTPFDANVEVIGDAGERFTATGMKVFEDIPVGTYTIKVSATSYTTVTETALVSKDETTNMSFKLIKPTSGVSTNADGIEMVFVKGGTFTMGCTSEQSNCFDNEKTIHQVTLSDFQIGKYEVTQKQWQFIMGSNPCIFKGDNLPVENVSWNDLQEFIQKLNQKTGKTYRLPTEAEWEYACRAGTSTPFYTGNNLTTSQANYDGNYPYNNNPKGEYRAKTIPVGSFAPNAWGLYDMHGNVWEWCNDWYGNYSSGSQSNPQGASSGSSRVLRGGSWDFIARRCRSASRNDYAPGIRSGNIGFRLALSDGGTIQNERNEQKSTIMPMNYIGHFNNDYSVGDYKSIFNENQRYNPSAFQKNIYFKANVIFLSSVSFAGSNSYDNEELIVSQGDAFMLDLLTNGIAFYQKGSSGESIAKYSLAVQIEDSAGKEYFSEVTNSEFVQVEENKFNFIISIKIEPDKLLLLPISEYLYLNFSIKDRNEKGRVLQGFTKFRIVKE